jgi:hypothetical protein
MVDALVHLAANPLRLTAQVPPTRARMAEIASTSGRTAPQAAPKAQTQPTPQAPPAAIAAALFSAEYGADVYARRLRRVLAAQAELLPAAMMAERRARGQS